MKDVLCVFLQIGEHRSRLGRVPVYGRRVIVLLVKLHIVADYLSVSVLSKRHVPGYAHGVGSLKEIGQVRRWPGRLAFWTEPISYSFLAETDVVLSRYSELVIDASLFYGINVIKKKKKKRKKRKKERVELIGINSRNIPSIEIANSRTCYKAASRKERKTKKKEKNTENIHAREKTLRSRRYWLFQVTVC